MWKSMSPLSLFPIEGVGKIRCYRWMPLYIVDEIPSFQFFSCEIYSNSFVSLLSHTVRRFESFWAIRLNFLFVKFSLRASAVEFWVENRILARTIGESWVKIDVLQRINPEKKEKSTSISYFCFVRFSSYWVIKARV